MASARQCAFLLLQFCRRRAPLSFAAGQSLLEPVCRGAFLPALAADRGILWPQEFDAHMSRRVWPFVYSSMLARSPIKRES
jgi:hypothetical protein